MNVSFATDIFLTTLVCLSKFDERSSSGLDIRANSDQIHFSNEVNHKCPTDDLNTVYLEFLSLNDSYTKHVRQVIKLTQQINQLENKIKSTQISPEEEAPSCVGMPSGLVPMSYKYFGSFYVTCDHDQGIYKGNWMQISQRDVGSQDFYLTWNEYQLGFGGIGTEFFIGLKKLNDFTTSYISELLVYLEKRTGEKAYAHYDAFSIGNETEKYALKLLGNYSGTAGDALRYHVGQKFTTRDQDNDEHPTQNCARVHAGAWWYGKCMESNLFGGFQTFGEPDIKYSKGILWKGFLDGPLGSIKVSKMFIRPKEK